jgi:hypothetical protein
MDWPKILIYKYLEMIMIGVLHSFFFFFEFVVKVIETNYPTDSL